MCNVSDYIWEKAAAEGMAQGLEKGMAQGIAQGLEKGMTQGLEKSTVDTIRRVASNMIRKGYQLEVISEITGCPLEVIKKIAAELQNS